MNEMSVHKRLRARAGAAAHCASASAIAPGFRSSLDPAIRALLIVASHAPDDPNHDFRTLYRAVKKRGYIPYPGKPSDVETFRVGCIGRFGAAGIPGAVAAVVDTPRTTDVRRLSMEAAA